MSNEDSHYEYEEPLENDLANASSPALRIVRLAEFEPPFTLSTQEREPYLRRFATLFVDESRTRIGGNATIYCVLNAFGERFALKVRESDFEREYGTHRLVSGVKGYPALYGKAQLDGKPVLVMEWIEGEDLLRSRARLAIDDEGRVSPLVAARLGRDLFDVLARTSVLEGGLTHGDLSPRNIMISTRTQLLDDQVQEGAFDLRLIDLGSAHVQEKNPASTSRSQSAHSLAVAATPEFAAPELLAGEGGNGASMPTPAADVYAASRIICDLLYGKGSSSFETAHCSDNDIAAVLQREPEVAVAVTRAAADLAPAPSQAEIATALQLVDDQLAELLQCGLSKDPTKRPSATAMRDAFESFSLTYASSVARALQGEPLDPLNAPFVNRGLERLSLRARNLLRVIGKSVSLGLLAAVVAMTGFALATGQPRISCSGVQVEGIASIVLAVALLVPLGLGFLLRGREHYDGIGLLRASIGVLAGGIGLGLLVGSGQFHPSSFKPLLTNAVFAVTVMAWCPLVLDCAFPPQSARVRKRYQALPSASEEEHETYHTVQNALDSGGDEDQP